MKAETICPDVSRVSFTDWLARCRPFARVALRYLTCFLAVFALMAMGSDGPWFPWPNLAGACVFAA
ncbi:MAG: hypothetical protein JW902_15935, partial [Syntrophaceae bacterium]|nr:hypothetical protein [Syntrophaceae bacterium]